jgi:hypothetical protein
LGSRGVLNVSEKRRMSCFFLDFNQDHPDISVVTILTALCWLLYVDMYSIFKFGTAVKAVIVIMSSLVYVEVKGRTQNMC